MSYFYKSVEDCVASKQHLASCDADGFCNNCGEQEQVAIEPLVTPAFEGIFVEPAVQAPFEPMPDMKYDDFIKFDIRTGTITLAEKIKKKDRLLHLEVYLGSGYGTRTIVAGIAEHFDPAFLIGMQVIVVANLEPRKLGGYESHGMILAGMGPTSLSLAGCMGVPDGTEIG